MSSETDNRKLLESKISQDDIYQLQGDSLIVWSDIETQIDMALSFQENEGCQQVWDEIRIIQGREPDSKEIVARKC
jgi:protein phosphatase-4 regulatory subunit 3